MEIWLFSMTNPTTPLYVTTSSLPGAWRMLAPSALVVEWRDSSAALEAATGNLEAKDPFFQSFWAALEAMEKWVAVTIQTDCGITLDERPSFQVEPIEGAIEWERRKNVNFTWETAADLIDILGTQPEWEMDFDNRPSLSVRPDWDKRMWVFGY